MNWSFLGAFFYFLIVLFLSVFHSILAIKFNVAKSRQSRIRLMYNITGVSGFIVIAYISLVVGRGLSIILLVSCSIIVVVAILIWVFNVTTLFISNKLQNYVVSKIVFNEEIFRKINRFYYFLFFGLVFIGLLFFANLIALQPR